MFDDSCCMCGKPTTGNLYCSNACKSQDFYPNLDDTPLLIPSRTQHSLSSSPTSSVMTTLSITDDLPPQVHPTVPIYGATTAQAVAAAFARTSMPPTPGEAPKRTPNSKYNMPMFPSAQDTASPATRKHRGAPPVVDVENTLHYVRRPVHQRSASSSTTSLLLTPAPCVHDHHSHDEKTMRTMRKQQRASLPAYFSLLSTPLVAQTEPRYEEWVMPQPQYQRAHDVTKTASVTPTVDPRGRSRTRSRSRSRGRTFTRRSSHGAPPSDTVESVVHRGRSRVPRDLEARAC